MIDKRAVDIANYNLEQALLKKFEDPIELEKIRRILAIIEENRRWISEIKTYNCSFSTKQ